MSNKLLGVLRVRGGKVGGVVRHGFSVCVVGAILIALSFSCTYVSYDELTCEQAVSRLNDCCPEIDSRRLPCVESEGGCASAEAEPFITARAGECILDDSCESMRASGKCDRLKEYSLVPHALKDRLKAESEVCR